MPQEGMSVCLVRVVGEVYVHAIFQNRGSEQSVNFGILDKGHHAVCPSDSWIL